MGNTVNSAGGKEQVKKQFEFNIILCSGTNCHKKKGNALYQAVIEELEKHRLTDRVEVILSGCLGMCKKGPVMVINPGYTIYGDLEPEDAAAIISHHIVEDKPFSPKVIHEDHLFNRFYRIFGDVKFFGKQMRIALRNCGIIDPEKIDDYLSVRGYEAIA
ncbi:MAG: hypothetical protein EHM28_08415, partial [Spirochaetaceae bacterium]